jgi:SAM-dependent methyltransferase
MHLTRYYMYKRLRAVLETTRCSGRILCVGNSKDLAIHLFDTSQCDIADTNYPSVNWARLPYGDAEFDALVSDQVLEHLEGTPEVAISESRRVLRRGGLLVLTTCFMNPVHRRPQDLWRFSPDGLRYLCRDMTEILEVGGWGNFAALVLIRMGLRRLEVPHLRWHPLHLLATSANPAWPIVTWIVARK